MSRDRSDVDYLLSMVENLTRRVELLEYRLRNGRVDEIPRGTRVVEDFRDANRESQQEYFGLDKK